MTFLSLTELGGAVTSDQVIVWWQLSPSRTNAPIAFPPS